MIHTEGFVRQLYVFLHITQLQFSCANLKAGDTTDWKMLRVILPYIGLYKYISDCNCLQLFGDKITSISTQLIMISTQLIMIIASLGLVLSAPIGLDLDHLNVLRQSGNDEEFAKFLGIDVSLVRPILNQSPETIRWKSVSPLGDILLRKDENKQGEGIRFDKYLQSKWSSGVIPYVIQESDFTPEQVSNIEAWIRDLNSRVKNCKIVKRGTTTLLPELDYVHVFSGSGCFSYIGKTGKGQPLSLQSDACVDRHTVQHEFLHAFGFYHEQNRPDRDEYIKLFPRNIPRDWRSQYEKVGEDFGVQGPYDYFSVMHYPVLVPEKNIPAFKVLQKVINKTRIGHVPRISNHDAKKLDVLYS